MLKNTGFEHHKSSGWFYQSILHWILRESEFSPPINSLSCSRSTAGEVLGMNRCSSSALLRITRSDHVAVIDLVTSHDGDHDFTQEMVIYVDLI